MKSSIPNKLYAIITLINYQIIFYWVLFLPICSKLHQYNQVFVFSAQILFEMKKGSYFWQFLKFPPMLFSLIIKFSWTEQIRVFAHSKGQLNSKCLFEKIVWTKIPTKNLIDSAHYTCWAECIKFFVGILVQTIFSKRHSEIN